jgi:hypothetical protein
VLSLAAFLRCSKNLFGHALEQGNAHAKTPPEVALWKYWIFIEIHPHQFIVSFDLSLHNFRLPKTEPGAKPITPSCPLLLKYQIHHGVNHISIDIQI